MKKQIFVSAMTVLVFMLCAFGLIACTTKGGEHTHSWGKWTSDGLTTHTRICFECNESDTKSHNIFNEYCADCGYVVETPIIEITTLYFNKTSLSLYIDDSETLSVTIIPVNATNQKLIWTSINNDVATVENGVVKAVSEGTTTIIVSSQTGKTAECTVTVAENTYGFNYSKYGNGYAVVGYTGNEASITVPSTYKNKPIVAIGYGYNGGFTNCSNIKSVILPTTLKELNYSAFYNCVALTEIVIPTTVTTIGANAFYNCTSLNEIIIPNSVITIDYNAFYGCFNLQNVVIPNSISSIAYNAFQGCNNIQSVSAPIAALENIPHDNLKILDITSGTTIFDSEFENCTKLEQINLSNSVTSIEKNAFNGCINLLNVSIGLGLTSIGASAFKDCSNLPNMNIPESVTTIGAFAFKGCGGLTEIIVPEKVSSIGVGAFNGCENLEIITIPFVGGDKDGDNYTVNSYMRVFGYIFGYDYTTDGTNIDGATFQVGIKQGTRITKYFYYIPSNLKIVNITGNIAKINSAAFNNCTNLKNITIPKSVSSIEDSAFKDCSNLLSIIIPDNVKAIREEAFKGCSSLKSIIIPDSVTSIGDNVFEECSSLTNITIPVSVASIGGGAFLNCASLTSIIIPNKVTSIKNSTFWGCSSLTNINIPDSVTSIEGFAFYHCCGLTSITIPNSVKMIGYYAFAGCSELTLYCEARSKPTGWEAYWNDDECPIIWDYKNKI